MYFERLFKELLYAKNIYRYLFLSDIFDIHKTLEQNDL